MRARTIAVDLNAKQLQAIIDALDPTEPTALNVNTYERMQSALASLRRQAAKRRVK